MHKYILPGLVLTFAFLLAGCSQKETDGAASADHANSISAPVKVPVTLNNAYMAKTLDANHMAVAPTTDFNVADKIYVGVVLHGQAALVKVKVEWSLADGSELSSQETALPVATAAVATLELSRAAPLKMGDYKAVVFLDGKPSWELKFKVGM